MKHTTSLVQLILKNLRLLNEANDKGLHHNTLDMADKKHFNSSLELIRYLEQEELVESDYDESVGIWFLSEYGIQCHKKGHFEPGEAPQKFDKTDAPEEKKFQLADTVSITIEQFTTIGKYLWLVMFVVIALVVLDNYLTPKEASISFPDEALDPIETIVDDKAEAKMDSLETIK